MCVSESEREAGGEREQERKRGREGGDEGREGESQLLTIIFTVALSFSIGKTGLLISL